MKKLFIGILSITILTACGGQKNIEEDVYNSDNKLQINFWVAQDSAALRDMIDGFNNSQDKYHLNAIFKGSYAETLTAGIAATKSRQQPHLLQVFEVGTGTMMSAKGIYKSADEIITKFGNTTVDSFKLIPGIQAYYSDKGKLQSFPFNSSTPVMLYNKEAFKKAGVDLNNIPQTFEEFEIMLQKLKNVGYVPMTSTWGSYVLVETLSAMHNIPFATYNNGLDNFKKARIALSEIHTKTFQYLKDWSDKELFKYYGRDDRGFQPFLKQETALMFGSSASQNALKLSGDFEYGVSFIPYFKEYTESPNNSMVGGASVWAFEGFSDEVYRGIAEFIKFTYSPQVMFEYHDATGYLPLTAGAYEFALSEGYYEADPEAEIPYLQFNRPIAEYSQGWRLGNFIQIRIAYEEVMEALFQGRITPEQAAKDYEARANQLLNSFEVAN
ncbi:MAG: extracellular solute-binding protein [Brevinema sp.]